MPPPPSLPFWFRLRQGKAEAAESNLYRLTAPNLAEAFIGVRQAENGRWLPQLKRTVSGPDLVTAADDFATPQEAWEAAFESYRREVVV
jgi:hypothetical protein